VADATSSAADCVGASLPQPEKPNIPVTTRAKVVAPRSRFTRVLIVAPAEGRRIPRPTGGATLDAAWALGDEARRGHLAPGTFGDVPILSGDVTSASPDEIRAMKVAATIVGGIHD
jgi:hypothetical protein